MFPLFFAKMHSSFSIRKPRFVFYHYCHIRFVIRYNLLVFSSRNFKFSFSIPFFPKINIHAFFVYHLYVYSMRKYSFLFMHVCCSFKFNLAPRLFIHLSVRMCNVYFSELKIIHNTKWILAKYVHKIISLLRFRIFIVMNN